MFVAFAFIINHWASDVSRFATEIKIFLIGAIAVGLLRVVGIVAGKSLQLYDVEAPIDSMMVNINQNMINFDK
jgi:hypothetical protein